VLLFIALFGNPEAFFLEKAHRKPFMILKIKPEK
jgi:hypothetical protein